MQCSSRLTSKQGAVQEELPTCIQAHLLEPMHINCQQQFWLP